MRLILDNLPITTYDLELDPESVRPGFEVGYELDGKFFVNNHLMFKVSATDSHPPSPTRSPHSMLGQIEQVSARLSGAGLGQIEQVISRQGPCEVGRKLAAQ